MILTKIIINTTSDGTDLVSNILIENGSFGTTIVDKKDVVEYMAANPKENYSETITKFYPSQALVVGVLPRENEEQAMKRIKNAFQQLQKMSPFNLGELSIRTEAVNDEHYSDIWMDYYKPFTVGKLKIFASWQKFVKPLFKVAVILKPGAAFGTGQHPTTESCLSLLQKLEIKNKTILDVGCGTGILGFCALKLGGKSACLTDIDDVAIESAIENGEINKLSNQIDVRKEDVVGNPKFSADIVFLNISTEWAIVYAEKIKQNITKAGHLIVSGILTSQKDNVLDLYKSLGFSIIAIEEKDNWVTFLARM